MTPVKNLVPLLVMLCCISTHAQTTLTDSLMHQDMYRHYSLRLPPGYTEELAPYPLVMVLHGGSGTMTNIQGFSQMNAVADEMGFIAAYPQGIGIAAPGYSWADGRNTSADQAGIDDVGFLTSLVDSLRSSYFVDSTRVYLSGFSNGGFMTMRMACEAPHQFAAMAALGCSMDTSLVQTCSPDLPVPMLILAGTSDPAVPYEGGPMTNPEVTPIIPVEEAVSFWVTHNACELSPVVIQFPDVVTDDNSTAELLTYPNGDCNSQVFFYRIIGGGHTWPGVELPLQETILGETNEDIVGSEKVWGFFNLFTNCGMTSGVESLATEAPHVFPNPAHDVVQLAGLPSGQCDFSLIHTTGARVACQVSGNTLDLRYLSPGMVILTIATVNSSWSTRIVVY